MNLKIRYLELMPEVVYSELSAADMSRKNLNVGMGEVYKLNQLFGSAYYLEIDDAGRVLLPERYINRDGRQPNLLGERMLGTAVSVVGIDKSIAIWNQNEFLWFDRTMQEKSLGEPLASWDDISGQAAPQISQG